MPIVVAKNPLVEGGANMSHVVKCLRRPWAWKSFGMNRKWMRLELGL